MLSGGVNNCFFHYQQIQLSTLITPTTTTTTLNEKECPECGHKQKISTDAKRTVCSKCDKPIRLRALTAILATVLMIAIVPASYAVEVIQEDLTIAEQKVLDDIEQAKADGTYVQPPEAPLTATIQKYSEDVVIQSPFPVQEWYCGSVVYKLNTPEMTCVIVGNTVNSIWTEQDQADAMAEKLEAQEAEDKIAFENMSPLEKQFHAIENTIAKLKANPDRTPWQEDQLAAYTNLAACARGTGDTEAFQTREHFIIPDEYIKEVNGVLLIITPQEELENTKTRGSGFGAKMDRAGEECRAQMTLLGKYSPDHYKDLVHNEDDFQPTHQEKAKLDKATAAFGINFTDRKDGDLVQEAEKSRIAMCLSENLTDKFKKQINCPSPYIGLYEPKEPSGFTLETAPPMIQHEKYGIVCGLIPNGHIVNDRHWEYLKSFQTVPANCGNWDRITAIMLFDPMKDQGELIDQVVLAWEEAQKQ